MALILQYILLIDKADRIEQISSFRLLFWDMKDYDAAPDTVRSPISFDDIPPSSKVKCKAKGKNKPVRYCQDYVNTDCTVQYEPVACQHKPYPKGMTLGDLLKLKLAS